MIFGHLWVKATLASIAFLIAIALQPTTALGQQGGSIGNLPTLLPNITKVPPREMGQLPTVELDPVSNYLHSVTGGDAIIEVYLGRSRIITSQAQIADEEGIGVIAAGDPTVIDFDVLPNPKMIRVLGKRVGVTDLTFVTSEGDHITYDIHVVFDLPLVEARMKSLFPDATFTLRQIREHVVIEGEARSPSQVSQIMETLQAYLNSLQVENNVQTVSSQGDDIPVPRRGSGDGEGSDDGGQDDPGIAFDRGERPSSSAEFYLPRIINLLRVPGPQQVMLKVTIAELNRSALRQLGTTLNYKGDVGDFLNSLISTQSAGANNLSAVFEDDFSVAMNALRENSVTTILAEPNLVTMSGHTSRFQSGGEFPVPVLQGPQGGNNSSTGAVTIEFKPFGVQLAFTPIIEADGTIRLTVEPEVSDIDPTLGTLSGGTAVPGIRTRNASTTVQMREGQTFAIAGLLNDASQATTSRLPLLGDIPYIGAFFTNDSANSREEELLIVVTPHLVSPIDGDYPGCLPGQDVQEPNDWEFYLLNRIEGRTGVPHRSTTNWDDPLGTIRKWQLERSHGCGPIGFSK